MKSKSMNEYDKKVEEVKALCKWFNDHRDEVVEHDDGVIIAMVYGEPERISNIAVGEAELIAEILARLTMGCRADYIRQGAN